MHDTYERVRSQHERKEISSQAAVNELEEALAGAIYEAAAGTIDSKVIAVASRRTPMHKRRTPNWWTRSLREREAQISKATREYYINRGNAEAQHAISARLDTLEDELAVEVGRTTRNIQREKIRDIERYFGEDEQEGHRKHAWDTIQDTRKRSRSGVGRATPWAQSRDGAAAHSAHESAQNWRECWKQVCIGTYRPEDTTYGAEHRARIESELERISELEEQRAHRHHRSSAWMKDAEDAVELELDAAGFEEVHGILVDEIDAEERGAYTELNAMWSSDELGPALKQMKHYKAAGEDGIVAEYMELGGTEVFDCILLLRNAVWRLECCPVRWTRSMAWPIYKAGARTDPNNYRLQIADHSAVCRVPGV
jgi:hypothetical protein